MAPPTRGAGTPKEHTYTNDHVAAILDNLAEFVLALDKVPGLTLTASLTVLPGYSQGFDPEAAPSIAGAGLTPKQLRNLLRDLAYHVANGQPYEGSAE